MARSQSIDFAKTAIDYSRHRAGFPVEFIARLKNFDLGLPGQRVLDLGTGTGTLARQFAQAGCEVSALDISEPMIEQAKNADRAAGVHISYRVAKAEEPPFAPEEFDMVVAGQCWHWFDRGKAAPKAFNLIKHGGSLVIAHFDWVPLDDNVVALTERLIEKHNPSWQMGGGTGIYPAWMADVSRAGFSHRETFSFDIDITYTHEVWLGRIRASAGIGGSLPPHQVEVFNRELAALLNEEFSESVLQVPHRVWALVARK